MFIFLDESGDMGFDFDNKYPSAYFVITVLILKNLPVFKSSVKKTLKNKINHKKKKRIVNELKGSATTFEIKNYFYQLIKNDGSWFLQSIILNKKRFSKNTLSKAEKETLYNHLSGNILKEVNVPNTVSTIHLYVDKRKTAREIKIFDNWIRSHLKNVMPKNTVLNIEHINSEKAAGLQAVDMFCYGIAKKHEHGDDRWYSLFKDRITKELLF